MNGLTRRRLSRRDVLTSSLGAGAAALMPGALRPHGEARADTFSPTDGTEILWDTWGVPHVFASDAPSLFYAFGWAQARSHGDLLLHLYGRARGRAAEYFGEEFLVADRAVRTMNLVGHAEAWHEAQTPTFRANLDAFAAGINAYAEMHPDALDERARVVLPVTGGDVLAHTARIFYLFLGGTSGVLGALPAGSVFGSNAWAIAPAHSADGHALLLANPHLFWGEETTFVEAHLTTPDVYDAYGATLVGTPVLAFAFNDHLGWAHTVNQIDAGDLYGLTLADGGYRFDGSVHPFETRTETIRVRQEDGSLREESLEVRSSVHGPVVEHDGATVAIRLAAFAGNTAAAGALEQWWDMGRATNLAEFEDAVARRQVPLFTVIYADREGHILSLFGGQVPRRPPGDTDWSGIVPGDTSTTLWTDVHPYAELPRVVDPPSGWVQNSNSAPWYTTYPIVLEPDDFPPYMAPPILGWRERAGIRMLEENRSISLDRLVELKYSTRMELAERVIDELIDAARQSGDAVASRAAAVLAGWDRQAEAGSTGVVLFFTWVTTMEPQDPLLYDLFVTPADHATPLTTPNGLADVDAAVRALVVAAEQVEAIFGRLDMPWGEVARLRRGAVDEPANGFEGDPLGVFRSLSVDLSQLGQGQPLPVLGGDTFIAAVEFRDPVRARVLMTYGNASQPGSAHVGDQLVLSARGELRPAWRTRAEIEANLGSREALA